MYISTLKHLHHRRQTVTPDNDSAVLKNTSERIRLRIAKNFSDPGSERTEPVALKTGRTPASDQPVLESDKRAVGSSDLNIAPRRRKSILLLTSVAALAAPAALAALDG